MAICKNCGAKIESKFCPYCGTKNEELSTNDMMDTSKQKPNTSSKIGVFANSFNSMFDILKITNQMKKEGRETYTDDELKAFEGVLQSSVDLMKYGEQSDLEFKEYKKKFREARRAIASGHCPECGADINKNDDYCPKCGADCLMEAYDI